MSVSGLPANKNRPPWPWLRGAVLLQQEKVKIKGGGALCTGAPAGGQAVRQSKVSLFQRMIQDRRVFKNAAALCRLGDHRKAALQMSAQGDLRRRTAACANRARGGGSGLPHIRGARDLRAVRRALHQA